jgi:DNA-binding beta-propeller fold protein YncE
LLDAARVIDELGIAYDPAVSTPPSLRPYVVKPLASSLLVFRRDRDHRLVEWVSLSDDSVITLDQSMCPHLEDAIALDTDREGRLFVLSERRRHLILMDDRGAPQRVLPWRLPGDPISIHCLDSGSVLIGTWKPGGLYLLDGHGEELWSWSPGAAVLAEARAVAAGRCGRYYIADASLHRIIVITPSGSIVRQLGITGSPGYGPNRFANPSMLEVDRDGGMLVCDTRNHRVVKVGTDDSIEWEWPQRDGATCRPTQLSMPWCARRQPDGGLVIADTYNFRVLQLDASLQIRGTLGSCPIGGRSLSLPRSAQRLGSGRYLIADTYSNRVVEMDRCSRPVWQFGCGPSEDLFWPRCAFRNAAGRTVIADSRNNRILIVNGDRIEKVIGEIARGAERSTLRDPHDCLETPDGHLIVADTANNRIVELAQDGAWLWTFPSPAETTAGWELSDPHNVGVDGDGRVLVSDTGNDRVLVVERRTGGVTEVKHLLAPDGTVTALKEPRGCQFAFGHYFILDSGNARVLILDGRHRIVWSWNGEVSASPLPQVLRPPRWLAVLSPRRLLITDSVNGRVVVLRLPRWWAGRSRSVSA